MMLMAFSLPIEAEPELLRKLDECCFKQLRSTNVEITGFELIEENRSVLITPRQHQFLSTVVRKVSTVVRSAGKAKLRTIKSPGAIPIAAELNPEKYNQAFALFENKVYARICFANNLVLLRVKAPGQTPQLVKSFSIL